jgi:hypothetical protein
MSSISSRCSSTHGSGTIAATPQTTARTPAASAAKVSVSHPLSSVGPPVWISSVAAVTSPPVSLRHVIGRSRRQSRRDRDRTRGPATIERLAATPLIFYDAESADDDPIRRQLAERAQALGIRLQPKVEVVLKDIALRLVAAGIGDTYLPSAYTYAPYYPEGLSTASFTPALYDTFAIITRQGARLSTGVRELLAAVEVHMRAVADELDRSR